MTSGTLAKIESQLGYILPDGYRRFMLASNGGEPVFPQFRINDTVQTIQDFLRIAVGGAHDLMMVRDALSDTLDVRRYLPIARTTTGDMVCIGLIDGEVSYWRHDQERIESVHDVLEPLAQDFIRFCDTLYAVESRETADSLHRLGKNGNSNDLATELSRRGSLVTDDGYTVGEIAAMHGNIGLFGAWTTSGMSIGRSLHIAAMNGQFQIVDHLTSLGLSINHLDANGKTPLDAASWDEDYKQELKNRGAKSSREIGGQ